MPRPTVGAAVLALSASGVALAADQYVALGDPYSAGYGANSTNLNLLCGRNTYARFTYVNGFVLLPTTDSYHPTRAGYASGYAPLVRGVIG